MLNKIRAQRSNAILLLLLFSVIATCTIALISDHHNRAVRIQSLDQQLTAQKRYVDLSIYYSAQAEQMYGTQTQLGVPLIKLVDSLVAAYGDSLVHAEMIFAMMVVESGFKLDAISSVGAVGLLQIMPVTAQYHLKRTVTEKELLNPRLNIIVGIKELRRLLLAFNKDEQLALLSYNRGQRKVLEDLCKKKDPENGYSKKIQKVKRKK